MDHYRKKKTKPPYKRDSYPSRPVPKESSRYKQKFFGSGIALIFLLAILYGRSEYYTPQSRRPKTGGVDYSRPEWMKKLGTIQPTSPSDDLLKDVKDIAPLVLILKEYRYWEKEVNLAREAKDEKKEEYALSNYRQAMEKIARYSDDAIKRAELKLDGPGPENDNSREDEPSQKD